MNMAFLLDLSIPELKKGKKWLKHCKAIFIWSQNVLHSREKMCRQQRSVKPILSAGTALKSRTKVQLQPASEIH